MLLLRKLSSDWSGVWCGVAQPVLLVAAVRRAGLLAGWLLSHTASYFNSGTRAFTRGIWARGQHSLYQAFILMNLKFIISEKCEEQ